MKKPSNRITPGPWQLIPWDLLVDSNSYSCAIKANDTDIYAGPCSFSALRGSNNKEAKANAEAISFVPDMLSIIEQIATSQSGTDMAEARSKAINLLNELNK